jgi:hypothetical protein
MKDHLKQKGWQGNLIERVEVMTDCLRQLIIERFGLFDVILLFFG